MPKAKSKPGPVVKIAGSQIVTMWRTRFMIPRSGPPVPVADGEKPRPNVMVITQYFVEVEWKGGGRPLGFKRYKANKQWWWSNPRHNRNNPHLPKRMTDAEFVADLAGMCYKGDEQRAIDLLGDFLKS